MIKDTIFSMPDGYNLFGEKGIGKTTLFSMTPWIEECISKNGYAIFNMGNEQGLESCPQEE